MTTDNVSTVTLADLADHMDAWSIAGLRALDSGPQWLPMSTVAVTAAYTFGAFDRVVFANATGGAFTVTLPAAANRRNQQTLTVIRTNSGANNVTIASAGGTINGAATVTITLQYDSHTFVSDGTNWWITTDALTGSAPTGNAGGDLSGTYPNPGVVQAGKLTTARTINGTSFDGSANITVAAAAGTLTGATLAAGVTAASLTSLGTLTALAISGDLTLSAPRIVTTGTIPTVGSGGIGTSALSILTGSTNTSGQFQVTATAVVAGTVLGVVAFGGAPLATAPKNVLLGLAGPTGGAAVPMVGVSGAYSTNGFTVYAGNAATTATYIITWIATF